MNVSLYFAAQILPINLSGPYFPVPITKNKQKVGLFKTSTKHALHVKHILISLVVKFLEWQPAVSPLQRCM